jgi:hypothetical protein
MAQHILCAGYVIADNDDVIHGHGITLDAAWTHAEAEFDGAGIALLGDDDDSTEQDGSWTRRSELTEWPASLALLVALADCGGAISWRRVGGVACTVDEAEG